MDLIDEAIRRENMIVGVRSSKVLRAIRIEKFPAVVPHLNPPASLPRIPCLRVSVREL